MAFWNTRNDKPILVTGPHAFYLNALLRGLVMNLVGVFTPIFVYREMGLMWVPVYYLLFRLTVLLTAIPVSHVIEKIGFRKSIATSMIFLTANLLVLAFASRLPWLVGVSALLGGMVVPFYWIARHSAVSQDSNRAQMGRTMGILATAESIASLLAPYVGGVVIMKFGYPVLYVISAVLLVISLVPLWYMPPHTHKNGATLVGLKHFLKDRRYFHQAVGMMGIVGHDYGALIIWPVLMYMLNFSTAEVGGVYSIAAIVWVTMRLVAGNTFDKLHQKKGFVDEKVFGIAAVLVGASLVLRLWVQSLTMIVILELASAFVAIFYSGFLLSYFHLGGRRMGSIAYYVYLEMVYSTLTVILMAMMIVGIYLGVWRELMMVICSLWVLLSVVIAKESNMK